MKKQGQQQQRLKVRIRKGDTVRVLLGKDRGKSGSVMAVLTDDSRVRVIVEGINMVMKHVRPKRSGEKGQRVSVAAPMEISNVQLVCPACKKKTRVGLEQTDDKKNRVCKKCGEVIDNKAP